MNIATILEYSAFHFPNRPAVSGGSVEISYDQLNRQANRVANTLKQMGVGPGDRAVICAPNSPEWIGFYFGLLKTGATAVPLHHQLQRHELERFVHDARPQIAYVCEAQMAAFEELRQKEGAFDRIIAVQGELTYQHLLERGGDVFKSHDADRNAAAVILYTGGTTGTPKGAILSHANILDTIYNVVFNERSTQQDRALCFLPFHHVFGLMHILSATVLSGGCVELQPLFEMDRVLAILAGGKVTKLFAVPTIYVRLLGLTDLKPKLGSVRYCFSAAASMAENLVRQWRERTGLSIFEAYGMTESASMVTYNHYHRHVVGSVGTPVGTTEVRIRDMRGNSLERGQEGEICIRGPGIMQGYLNKPDETRDAFWHDWFRSGDIGVMDPDGYLYILDRIKDMIITGGENVYPREIEEFLYTLPQIQECAVIGLPDKEWGERVTAFIIPKPGETIDASALKARLKEHLSGFKIPKEFRVVEDLPRSPAGKILKRTLKRQMME